MAVNLSDHFTYKKLLKAVMPPIMMMVFTSIYCIVDGIFISNFVGKTAFASVNFIMPILNLLGGLGFMTGTGGSALIAKTLGEKNDKKASEIFANVMHFTTILGITVSVLGAIFIRPISVWLGATPEMIEDCVTYGRIMMAGNVLFMLECTFQGMLMTAGRPMFGFIVTLCAGLTNIIGDGLLVGVFKFGLIGAASATLAGYTVGTVIPCIFFLIKKTNSTIHYCKAKPDLKSIGKSCYNGMSELFSNIAASVVGVLYNMQLLKYAGEDGVAAYGVIMYACFIFAAVFFGYAQGVSPLIAYHFGAKNKLELQNLFKKSMIIMAIIGTSMSVLTVTLAGPLSKLFVGYDIDLMNMTIEGMRFNGISFLIFGFNIFASGFFTALNNGTVSAIVSVARILVFKVLSILLIPLLWGITGIWVSDIFAELLSLIVSFAFILGCNKKYGYLPIKKKAY